MEEVKQRKSSAGVAVTPTPPTVDQGRSGAPQLTKRASSIKSVGGIFKANFSMITAAVPLAADSKNSPSFAGATSDRHSITRSSDSSSEFYSPIGSPLQPSSKRSSDVPVMAHPVAIKNVNLDRFAAAVPTGADHSSGVGNGRANGNANVHANGYVTKKSCPEFHPEVTCLLQMIPSKARKVCKKNVITSH